MSLILEEPRNHLRLLRWTAVIGITIGWLGGLPAALAHIGVLDVPPAAAAPTGPPPRPPTTPTTTTCRDTRR